MKKVRTTINVLLGSLIAALGVTGCEEPQVKYGVLIPEYGCPVDTTVQVMYGVPAPELDATFSDQPIQENED